MTTQSTLIETLPDLIGSPFISCHYELGEITCEVKSEDIVDVCTKLRDAPEARFDVLIDLCAVDYSDYGKEGGETWEGSRYAVVYHLLSIENNSRIRLRANLSDESSLGIPSIIGVWAGADWFEREAFDLFGIIFVGHPDLRRLLTDYGFIGHPFRKDFPISGKVEMRYDENQGRVIYQPVTIEPRTLVPRTIRKDVFSNTGPNAGSNSLRSNSLRTGKTGNNGAQ
ncbi:MAG: NADH-quinone oxidoreductase subunit C [Gammaproteobacteria bacterium]|nr:NADH-quinone oxidoreductase subunit C [Gammaproteobacteria bacterium]